MKLPYQHEGLRMTLSSTDDMVRLEFFAGSSHGNQAARFLIEDFQKDSTDNTEPHLIGAGHHMGMPLYNAWVMTSDGSPVASHLETILSQARSAMERSSQ